VGRSRSQESLIRTRGRPQAGRILIALTGLGDVGLVILVERLEKRVIGILQLVNVLAALRVTGDGRISVDLDEIGGTEGTVATFGMPHFSGLVPCVPALAR